MSETNWYVYLIECTNGMLYCGITTDLERRLSEHKSGKGAKFFKGSRRPKKIVYSEVCKDRSSALKREAQIKKLRREEKLQLIKKT